MAGSIFGLGLSQQVDASGVPLSGALLYIFEANTTTPVTTYADFGLTTTNTFPIVCDSAGRIPPFWVADGAYRARLTTSTGIEVFNYASVTALGASSGGGASSGSSVDATTVFATGDTLWVPIAGSRTGWVRANGRTIGNGASGASERANSDTSALYVYLYTNFSDTLCPVTSGRGSDAASDFNAGKPIGTLDMRGCGAFGLDDMGNSAASIIAAGTPTTAGTGSGAETVTISQANLPNVSLVSSSLVATITNGTNVFHTSSASSAGSGSGTAPNNGTISTVTCAITGTVPLGGSGTATNKMPPYRLGSWYLKL